MTVCVGFTDGKTTWLASDRMCSNGNDPPFAMTKIMRRQEWALVITGSSWLLDVAKRSKVDPWLENDPHVLIRAVRDTAKEDGWIHYDNHTGDAPVFCVGALLARAGKLWFVDSCFYPHIVARRRVSAHGCGASYALGAANVMLKLLAPNRLVYRSVEVACELSPRCGMGIDMEILT